MKLQNKNVSAIIGVIFLGLVLGCGFGQTCTGELTFEGTLYRGKDKDAEQAKRNACTGYCIEGSSHFDDLYRVWLNSPKGKKVRDPESKESKWAAMAEDKDLNAFVKKCTAECYQEAAAGKRKMEVRCE